MAADRGSTESLRWTRFLLESVVIVASILLALGAEAYWQARVDRAEEQVLLTSLHAEFVANEAALRAQSDSIDAAIALVTSVAAMSESDLVRALESDAGDEISMAIRRPWTVEVRVGALEGTLGTQRASLIRSHQLLSDLAQYQAVQVELSEIGDLVTTLTVDAFVTSYQLPENHRRLTALLGAKLGYWEAYSSYLARLIAQTEAIADQLEGEIN